MRARSPAREFEKMKKVVVAAVVLGLDIPPRSSMGARYTPPPIPVRPAMKPIKHPIKIICIMPTLMFAKGLREINVNRPEPVITRPITSLSMYSEIMSDNNPPINDRGMEPATNKMNLFSKYILHLMNDIPVLIILNNKLPIAA